MGVFEKLILIIGWLNDFFIKRPSTFKIGDVVELKDGTGYPMLVVEVHRIKKKNPMLYCKWYDVVTKETRFNFYHEKVLNHYYWNKK